MKINFINHACITIEENNEMIMFDPWFFGKVFNNSWSLIKETNIDELDLSNLKFILITHEHPDHLHWATLKLIKEKTTNDVRILIPRRNNKNVIKQIIKLGFQAAEIPSNKQFKISNNFKVTNFTTGHDSAYIIQTKEKTILNQNDCKLSDSQVREINSNYPVIDFYFMQFSLAGFYANKSELDRLRQAKLDHINMIKKYKNYFNPKITIPFASYVYFCREENSYLNDYIVNLSELDSSYQIVTYGDAILHDDFYSRNKLNLNLWNNYLSNLKIDKTSHVDNDSLVETTKLFFNSLGSFYPPKTSFSFYKNKESFVVDYKNKNCYFTSIKGNEVAKVTMYDLECFFKFPWGADTMNITSCFEIYDKELWKKNLIFKDSLYRR
jgi:hypothetical protein